jgi:hypothetical protein
MFIRLLKAGAELLYHIVAVPAYFCAVVVADTKAVLHHRLRLPAKAGDTADKYKYIKNK